MTYYGINLHYDYTNEFVHVVFQKLTNMIICIAMMRKIWKASTCKYAHSNFSVKLRKNNN